ncbi:MAG: hypothetical protein ABIE94_02575 [archaeon]
MSNKPKSELELLVQEGFPHLKEEVLKGVYRNCTGRNEGGKTQPLFYRDVELTPLEVSQVQRLLGLARAVVGIYAERSTDYTEFRKLADEASEKGLLIFGFMGSSPSFEVHDDRPIEKIRLTKDGSAGISVTSYVNDLYRWDRMASSVDKQLRCYLQPELSSGTDAGSFGKEVKRLYEYVLHAVDKEGLRK